MENKKYAKRYVFSLLGLYFSGVVFLFLITFFLSNRNDVNNALTFGQVVAVSLLLPLLPCSSFAGFCTAFRNLKEFKRRQKIALVFFFPITLALITLYGFIMLLPSFIKQFAVLIRKSGDS